MSEARANLIPNFIKASSPFGLRRLMLINNAKLGGLVQYFDIQQTLDGKWIAWYFAEIRSDDELLTKKAGE